MLFQVIYYLAIHVQHFASVSVTEFSVSLCQKT